MKYMNAFLTHFSKRTIFSVRDAKIFLKKYNISENYLHLIIHGLLKKKKMFRLTRGIYTFHKDLLVSGFAFYPFYYGLQEALSQHNLWQQQTNPVIITVKKARIGTRKIMDSNIVVHRIKPKMFFGYETKKHENIFVPVSTIEKTLIDFYYFKQPLDSNTLKKIKKKTNLYVLKKFLKKTPKKTVKQVKNALKDFL